MSLSCECGDFDGDGENFYNIEDIERVAQTDYKCYGCCKQGHAGDHVRRYTDEHWPDEDECHEQDIPEDEAVVDKYRRLCESCGDLFDSLSELGFCMSANWGFIKEAHQEYKDDYVRGE